MNTPSQQPGSREAIEEWRAVAAQVIDEGAQASEETPLPLIDRLFPEPDPGDDRAMFSASLPSADEVRGRGMLVDSETTRRINAACDGSDIEGSEEDLGFLRLVPVDVELAVGATPAVGPSEADEAAAWRGGMRFDTEGFLREISGLTEFERSRLRRDVISAALSHIALGTITFDCGDDQLIRTFAAEMDWRALAAEDTLIRQARIISD